MSDTADKGLYLDDLYVGQEFVSGTQRLDAEEIVSFAARYDPQPFHLDDEAAKDTLFKGLAASGWNTAATSMRLLVECAPFADGLIGGHADVYWPMPTRPGDVLQLTATVEEIVPSKSRPERARVIVKSITRNQNGETVQVMTSRLIAFRRPENR
ncbi:MaoC family dehydratase [Oricola sp.]|uniref:MaoC family dehydratase n=1 Tax=Oricola sp. TaxID=1979950 RepID=UPI003BA91624